MDSDMLRGPGSKRSALDRLGSGRNVDSLPFTTLISNNKRRKDESYGRSLSVGMMEDVGIDKYDLRFKLMEKSVSKRVQSGDDRSTVDLREKLSRMAPPPVPARVSPAYGYPDVWQHMPESKDSGLLGRFPRARNSEGLSVISSSKISNNPWTLDHIRRRSPTAVVSGSRGLSPTRKVAEPDRVPLRRRYDTLGAASYVSRDVLDGPRSANSSKSFISSSALPGIPSKPTVSEIAHFPSPSGCVQKRSYMGDEYQTVEGLLNSLGLEKYAVFFKAEEVDLSALKQMQDSDLKELGIPMGPRKKILLALLPRSSRQH